MALRLGLSARLRLQAPAPPIDTPPSPPPPPPPPPPLNLLVTTEGDVVVTDTGHFLVWETQ